jgi:hypothetical protein
MGDEAGKNVGQGEEIDPRFAWRPGFGFAVLDCGVPAGYHGCNQDFLFHGSFVDHGMPRPAADSGCVSASLPSFHVCRSYCLRDRADHGASPYRRVAVASPIARAYEHSFHADRRFVWMGCGFDIQNRVLWNVNVRVCYR